MTTKINEGKVGFNKSTINPPGVLFCKVKRGVYSKSRVIVPISKIFCF